MSVPRFHVEDLTGPAVTLPDSESRHASRSRRLSAGDAVVLFDGRGRRATGVITACGTRQVTIAVERVEEVPRVRPALTLAFAPPKGPRQDALIEKCTELGVAVFQPLGTARSVAGASAHRLDKWRRIAVEAAKQAGLDWLPELRDPRPLRDVLADAGQYDLAMLAVAAAAEATPIADLLPKLRAAGSLLALIGPEGGWTEDENAGALEAGFAPVSLGPNVLRIETAAIALAAAVHAVLRSDDGPF